MGCLKLSYYEENRGLKETRVLSLPQLKRTGSPVKNRVSSYSYAYNGMEVDPEFKGDGNSYTTEFRQYDPRIGRWMSLDPMMLSFPSISPYVGFDDNPVLYVDPYGMESETGSDGGGDPPAPGEPDKGNGGDKQKSQDPPKKQVTYDIKIQRADGSLVTKKTYAHTHVNLQKTGEKYLAKDPTRVTRVFDESGKLLRESVAKEIKQKEKKSQGSYIPPPKDLPGFPGAEKLKNQKGKRPAWKLPDGGLGEWDSQHGEVEVYDKTGKTHKGAWDPETGEQKKPPVSGRRASRSKLDSPNAAEVEQHTQENVRHTMKYDEESAKQGVATGGVLITILTILYFLLPV